MQHEKGESHSNLGLGHGLIRREDVIPTRGGSFAPRNRLHRRYSDESLDYPIRDHSREVYYPQGGLIPYGNERRRSSHHSRSRSSAHRRSRSHRSDSEIGSDFSSDDEQREYSKMRKKSLLVGCLASITTIAAANNIYQSTKAHEARRKQVLDGDISEAEAQKLKKKGQKLDLSLCTPSHSMFIVHFWLSRFYLWFCLGILDPHCID